MNFEDQYDVNFFKLNNEEKPTKIDFFKVQPGNILFNDNVETEMSKKMINFTNGS